ncbi:hypothetical protein [Treponema pedis]|uniref:Uncharacterized protein n=1 Tax=Treponema pedis TaxID=409322 RepID=A0A7S6WRD8_9SPIR|nr:hypothetical protein [Treponema pedis]QOW61963.1 hypothetical protein IFE08_06390 [Treponema pedis]
MKINFSKLFFVLLFFAAAFSAAAASDGQLLVHKTEYFDIIYAKKSESAAALIAEYADSYAEEISSRLNCEKPPKRMPVYIISDKEDLNGYFTSSPYSRIVLYDTLPGEGQLSNFNDVILKVFYHELTHAISLKYLFPLLPLSFKEGVAVLFESSDGTQGRLHDPLIYHHLMQGRIDGVSPSWQQAADRRDIYPGAFWGYLYGAAFADYLQKIYGMETYAKYWHSSFNLFPMDKTKKIFNKKLTVLWDNFIDSIYFPQEVQVPMPSIKGKNKSGFNVTAANKNGFACFDFAQKEVLFYNAEDVSGKLKKLFNANSSLSNLSFSQDGNYLLVTDLIRTVKGEKHRAVIFDMKAGKFLDKKYFSIRDAAFCGNNKICGVEVGGQFSQLIVLDYSTGNKDILFSAGPGKSYSVICNPVFAGENKIAFIAGNGLKRDILILDTVSGEIKKLEFEQPLHAIRYLQTNNSSEEPVLTFSWAEKNMLYRSAFYNVKTNTLKVLQKDISGGTFFPVVLSKPGFEEIFYVGMHAKYNSLYKIKEKEFKERASALKPFTAENAAPLSKAPDVGILKQKKYNYFSWLWKVSPSPVIKMPPNFKKLGQSGLGIKLSGLDASELLSFSFSSVFYFKPFFYQPEFEFKVNSKPANFKVNVYDINNGFRYRRTGITLGTEAVIPTESVYGNFLLNAGASFETFAFYPEDFGTEKTLYKYKLGQPVISEEFAAGYSYKKIKQRLATDFFAQDISAAEVILGVKHGIHLNSKTNAVVVQALANFNTPVVPLNLKLSSYAGFNAYLNPKQNRYAFFGNSAFVGMHCFLPGMPEYEKASKKEGNKNGKIAYGFGFDGELTLFSYEIQTGSFWLPIFYNRLNLSAGYRNVVNFLSTSSKTKPDFYQSLYGRLTLRISGAATIGIEYAHPIEKGVKFGRFDAVFNVRF